MRQFISILITIFFVFPFCYAQEKAVRVTMKSGTTITGTVTELNPTSHIVIKVAGFDSKIEINEISSIEDLALSSSITSSVPAKEIDHLDRGDYPESYVLKIGPYDIEMVLVRGNQFDMGYDGRGSISMHSEPIHSVLLNSFYVNKMPLTEDVVSYLKKGKESFNKNPRVYSVKMVKDAQGIIELLASETNLPIQLISEAQCEYVLTTGNVERLDLYRDEMVYCRDIYSEYVKTREPQIDPEGPDEGNYVVRRNLAATGDQIYRRYYDLMHAAHSESFSVYVRFSFPASAIVKE